MKSALAGLCGAFQGNHKLGSVLWPAGVTGVAGPKLQFDGSQDHEWRPRGFGAPGNPTGYSRIAWFFQFPYTISTGTVGTAHWIFSRNSAAAGTADLLGIKEKTDRDLEFYLDSTLMLTWTPSAEHHIYIILMKSGGGASLAAGEEAWLTVLIDKTVVLNIRHTMSAALNPTNGPPYFGEQSAISGSSSLVWNIGHYNAGFTDWDDPIGKITDTEWALTLAGSPVWNQSTKSTGTDAAALVDERPPAGSGTTDSDYYKQIPNTTGIYQTMPLADNLLGAGDTLLAVNVKVWDRAAATGKNATPRVVLLETAATALINDIDGITSGETSITYDNAGGQRPVNYGYIRIDDASSGGEEMWVTADSGTVLTVTRAQNGTTAASHANNETIRWFAHLALTTLSGITSYAEHVASAGVNIFDKAPDNTVLSGKANAYLNTLEVGVGLLRSSDNTADLRVDAVLVEAAIVLSGDDIAALDDPPSTGRRIFIC